MKLFSRTKIKSVKNVLLGSLVLVGTLLLAFSLSSRLLLVNLPSIAITFVGTFLGAVLLSSGMQVESGDKAEVVKQVKNELKLKEYDKLERRLEEIVAEKERLERMKIQVSSFQPMLKLSLLECDLTIHDFKDEVLEEYGSQIPFQNKDTSVHYVGLLCRNFKARLGIDLNKVKVMDDGDKLLVSEIKSEYQGLLDSETVWKIKEIRKQTEKNGRKLSDSLVTKDSRLFDCMVKQEQELNQRIKNGVDIKANERVVELFGQTFISMMLSPLNKQVVFSQDVPDKVSLPLFDYIQEKNKQLDDAINENKKLLSFAMHNK